MKNKGSGFEYTEQRNNDVMRAYFEQLGRRRRIQLPVVFRELVDSPSKRFWVTAERAAIVISDMIRGDNLDGMRPLKKEMYIEIYNRVMKLKEQFPKRSIYELVFEVVQQPAPKFYLTAGSARFIYYKTRGQWFEKRMRRLLGSRYQQ